jgi:hypothetical protein
VLPDSLAVQLRTPAGAPVQGADVTWAVTAGGGQVSPTTARTDAQGRARAVWTMGTAVGPAQATARVDDGVLTFSAVARVGAPATVQVIAGNGQSATRGTTLRDLLVVRVVDANGNPRAKVPVHWNVLAGMGHVEQPITATGVDGTALTRWAVGLAPGENTVAAEVEGAVSARFTAIGTAGQLRLSLSDPYPLTVQQIDTFTYRVEGYSTAYVFSTPAAVIGAAISWESQGQGTLRPFPPAGFYGTSSAFWSAEVDRREVVRFSVSASFEDQRLTYIVDPGMFVSFYGLRLSTPPGPYSAFQTLQVHVRLQDYEYSDVYLDGFTCGVSDDNGWNGAVRSGEGMEWPLGAKTGTRTLTVCSRFECAELVVQVGP